MKRLFWVEGRFSWWFVAAALLATALLLFADHYWRTNPTNLSRFF